MLWWCWMVPLIHPLYLSCFQHALVLNEWDKCHTEKAILAVTYRMRELSWQALKVLMYEQRWALWLNKGGDSCLSHKSVNWNSVSRWSQYQCHPTIPSRQLASEPKVLSHIDRPVDYSSTLYEDLQSICYWPHLSFDLRGRPRSSMQDHTKQESDEPSLKFEEQFWHLIDWIGHDVRITS